jgi:hypothetical protein
MQTRGLILPELASGRGTTRRVVEGQSRPRFRDDMPKHRIGVAENIDSSNSQSIDSSGSQPLVTRRISVRPVSERVSFSVHFNS